MKNRESDFLRNNGEIKGRTVLLCEALVRRHRDFNHRNEKIFSLYK